ncbi:MAG TPA: 2-C-methyl-D-erythritol 2,4-cyclodiphosphate synthase, partial [Desulfopila sp.]|nr:2-C-methyl-D-erythritol 2,4-cyclodiphosphate synthase [Desulfopila sp.]
GRRRQDSVRAGVDHLGDDIDIVLVHDGARPLVDSEVILRCLEAAERSGAAIAAVPVKDTLKRGDGDDRIAATIDRKGLWQAQTPQAARLPLLRRAFAAAGESDVTDEAMLLENAGIPVSLVMGAESNIKITRPEDLIMAEKLLMQADSTPLRIGHGFDAHRFAPGRRLVLGGVEINHHQGLAGHSDADVVTHAICDAILGALGLGDIGRHFPDSADEYKDIYSILLLERVSETMHRAGFIIGNIDITVVCQQPKLTPGIDDMRRTLARACGAESSQLNIKATTTEKMGYTGREEGISCHAVALLTAALSSR